MIVPMKKISLVMLDSDKKKALKILRRLGLLHIDITEGSGTRLDALKEQIAILETAVSLLYDRYDKSAENKHGTTAEMLAIANKTTELLHEKETLVGEANRLSAELDRISIWGSIDPAELSALRDNGLSVTLCEMPASLYDSAETAVKTLVLARDKNTVRFLAVSSALESEARDDITLSYRVKLPETSTEKLKQRLISVKARISDIETELKSSARYIESMKNAVSSLKKDVEFETYVSGMAGEVLPAEINGDIKLSYFTGYLPADGLEKLQVTAKENSWAMIAADPTPDDNAPTQIKNNKFVSLIYPLTDFLGTVPGYFEYDISAWFLGFILVFFGIIFGDGGYGLLICGIAGGLILKARMSKKPIPPAYLLILLMGGATIIWGILTCTWFGISPSCLPSWLKSISVPVISNVYADKIWYPFWTNGSAGLTTTQNVQIFCFTLALVQLSAAHIKGLVRNRRSLKLLGDLGAVFQLMGIYYIVLSLVVNSEVFGFGLVISGIPIGTAAIILIAVGFLMNFVFSNYEGSIGKAIVTSLKGIVSSLLGVVNVFSDIVSYIRLWAVGLAGAAISATVNELASPLLGNFLFMIFAVVILIFGHGLNMILNVLSVIVHGVRLNTLEFSTHLDMSWSGHKYEPFKE